MATSSVYSAAPTATAPGTAATPDKTPDKRRADLTVYLVIAFGMAWLCWGAAIALGGSSAEAPANGPYALGAFSPLVGALVIRLRRKRRGEPVPEHVVPFRAKALIQAPLLMVLASATVLAAAFLGQVAGGPEIDAETAKDAVEKVGGPLVFVVGMIVTGPLSEEAGWRGTVYPRMRRTMGRFQVGLVLGVIWSVWHLPLFFINDTPQSELGLFGPSGVLFAVSAIPMAMLVAAAYERAGIVAAMAVHFAVNTTMVLLDVKEPMVQAMIIGIQILAVVALLATHRPAAKAVVSGRHASVATRGPIHDAR